MQKYGNKKTVIDGIKFDSQKEASRYTHLKLLERAGTITDLRLQVPFELVPAQYETFERYSKTGRRLKDGKRCVEKSLVYVADFVYEKDGATVVEDAKGMRTPGYIMKRKLMLHVHGIRIVEV